MLSARTWLRLTYRAGHHTVYHDGLEMSGYLAFLELLAFIPFLVVLTTFAGLLGEGQAGIDFVHFLFDNLPQHMVNALKPRVEEITSGPPLGLLTIAITTGRNAPASNASAMI